MHFISNHGQYVTIIYFAARVLYPAASYMFELTQAKLERENRNGQNN